MAITRDTIVSQIPNHIIKDYPRFFEFLEAYYEWLSQEGNPYERVKHHMDYLSFEKSMDDYISHMKQEYLVDVPESVLIDKELFIKWSKKFNIARGSHASYKFMFKLLFNEQDTEIYTPKDNILRTSDGSWVSGESLMMITNSGNQEQFQFQRVYQKRHLYGDIYEYAYATVQRVRTKYAGRYNLTELAVTNIEGEFLPNYPIESELGGYEWIINTAQNVAITNGGEKYQTGERIIIDGLTETVVEREAEENRVFDTRLSSFFHAKNATVLVDDTEITDFSYDGRNVISDQITVGSKVTVRLPPYQGYLVVESVDQNGAIQSADILDLPIGTTDEMNITVDGIGFGATGKIIPGVIKPVKGYYEDTRGHLSSNMYLQDSFYYQDYSYAIQTEQDFEQYANIVKEVLHPAGFLMFGQITVVYMIELLLGIIELDSTIEKTEWYESIEPGYSLGPNHSFFARFKGTLSPRLYKMGNFNNIDFGHVDGSPDYSTDVGGETDRTISGYYMGRYFEDAYFEGTNANNNYIDGSLEKIAYELTSGDPKYKYELTKVYSGIKGWMTKSNLCDYYLYVPQDYSTEKDSGMTYFETGYVSERT